MLWLTDRSTVGQENIKNRSFATNFALQLGESDKYSGNSLLVDQWVTQSSWNLFQRSPAATNVLNLPRCFPFITSNARTPGLSMGISKEIEEVKVIAEKTKISRLKGRSEIDQKSCDQIEQMQV